MRLWPALLAALLCAACSGGSWVTRGGGATIEQARSADANGPQLRIAVGQILDKTDPAAATSLSKQLALFNAGRAADAQLSTEAVTRGLHDMLITELFGSGQFIVLDRGGLDAVMLEQDFSNSARVGDATHLPTGQLEGADLLVVGALTAFDTGASGGAIPIPIPLGRDFKYGAGVLSLSYKKGRAAMDLRIIDVATGRIVAATAVEGSNWKYGLNLEGLLGPGYGWVKLPPVLGLFSNTPIEQALQKMVAAAVEQISAQHPVRPPAAAATAPEGG